MPFGSMRIHEGTDLTAYKFTDQELDAETGLYNYGARLYDPVIGRFICADIIIPDLYNPQSLNRYSYCLNNPLIYVDPNGQNYGGYGDADTADSAETGPGGSSDASGGGYTDVNDNTNNSIDGLSDPSSSDDGNETSDSEARGKEPAHQEESAKKSQKEKKEAAKQAFKDAI